MSSNQNTIEISFVAEVTELRRAQKILLRNVTRNGVLLRNHIRAKGNEQFRQLFPGTYNLTGSLYPYKRSPRERFYSYGLQDVRLPTIN